jgi:hypothetical protein
MASVDGAALVAAAVLAAVLAKAPRRTVAAVAASVTCALARLASAVTPPRSTAAPARVPTAAAGPDVAADDAPALLAALRSARALQRRRKKERRKAGKAAAAAELAISDDEPGQPQELAFGGVLVPSLLTAPGLEVEPSVPVKNKVKMEVEGIQKKIDEVRAIGLQALAAASAACLRTRVPVAGGPRRIEPALHASMLP